MDRMLPGGIGRIAIIETLRRTGNRTPILILSALGEVDERIQGLKAGGDELDALVETVNRMLDQIENLVESVRNVSN